MIGEIGRTLLLDMNGTFMFGHDRFGPTEDFFATYQALGGDSLSADTVDHAARTLVGRLDDLYHDPGFDTAFPAVADVAAEVLGTTLSQPERMLVEQVVAHHELGSVSEADAAALEALSQRYALVVVSNLWSTSGLWRDYLHERVSRSCFRHLVFSSDVGINKPAPQIFEHALSLAGAEPSEAVMVGDDPKRDIEPAAGLGMKTAWITPNPTPNVACDLTVPRLSELLRSCANE